MYVYWKSLFGVGTVFWAIMCLYDVLYIDPTTKSFYYSSDEFDWLQKVSEKEIIQVPIDQQDDIELSDLNGLTYSMVMWNVVTFFMTICLCFVGKYSLNYLIQFQEKHRLRQEYQATRRATSNSKIPVLLLPKTANDGNKDAGSVITSCASLLSNSSTSIDLTIRPSKSEMCSRIEHQMEKQCAKLRDEMLTLQANSLKEHAALSRKLESISREKRDLYRQLQTSQKENRAAKHQLEELLAEKSMLVKRLECASREFKMNTKSKKAALAKLEECQDTISQLKQELDKVVFEKETLETKFTVLEAEHESLKERLDRLEPPSQDNILFTPNSIVGFKKDNGDAPKEPKQADCYEISQSQKDVQRVQMRLIDLEKSLDRLRLMNWGKKDSTVSQDMTEEDQDMKKAEPIKKNSNSSDFENDMLNLSNLLTSKAEAPLEVEESNEVERLLLQSEDNLTDEQRRRILAPVDSSEDSNASKSFDRLLDFKEDPFERVGNLLSRIRRPRTPNQSSFTVICHEMQNNETSTTSFNDDDDDSDDWIPPQKNRLVSNSPAFQKFLKRMEPQPTKKKHCITTQVLF